MTKMTDEERRAARNADSRKWRAANKEKHRAAVSRWNVANPGKSKARSAAWRVTNPDKVKVLNLSDHHRAAVRKWRAANKEKHYTASLRWNAANPEKLRVYIHRRRALRLSAQGMHTAQNINALYDAQGGRCAYCGCDVSQGYHVDHIVPLSRGGSNAPFNLALTCARCNTSKGAKLLSEWTARPSRSRA